MGPDGSRLMAVPRQLPNTITIVRILCAPIFLWMLIADGGRGRTAPLVGGGPLHRRDRHGRDRRLDRAQVRHRHRPRKAPRPHRRQGADGLRLHRPVDPRRAAVVGHDRRAGARGGHHGASTRGRQRPRRRGRVDGQAEDAGAGGRALARAASRCGRSSGTGSSGSTSRRCGSPCCSPSRAASTTSSRRCAAPAGSGTARERIGRRPPVDAVRRRAAARCARAARGWSIGVAESLTGGLVVESLVAVPGRLGERARRDRRLRHAGQGVAAGRRSRPPASPRRGASRGRASDGGRRARGAAVDGEPADVGLSTTGIAGPDSPDGQPVGTVFLGVVTPHRVARGVAAPAGYRVTRSGARPRAGPSCWRSTPSDRESDDGRNTECFASVTFGDSQPFPSPGD